MKSSRAKVIAGIVVLLLIVGGFLGFRYLRARAQSPTSNNQQTATVTRGNVASTVAASGTVRPRQTANLSWKTTGVVGTVNVTIGEQVKKGQVLASLDPGYLPQNIISAQTDLASAQQSLDELMTSQLPRAQALQAIDIAQKALDDYQNNFPSTRAKTFADLVTAQQTLTTTINKRTSLDNSRASQGDIDAAQANYLLMQDKVKSAQQNYNQVSNKYKPADPRVAQALIQLSDAEKQRDAALATLNWYTGKPTSNDLAAADASVAQAQAALDQAKSAWEKVKDGPDATQLAILKATLADAQAAYNRIKDGPNPNDVAALKARITSDQETISQQQITALFDGTVTDLNILPQDQASSGTTAFRIDDFSHLYVDVTVAEIDIPRIQVGQAVNMTFDAVANKKYQGKVIEVSQVGTSTQGVVQFGVTVEFDEPDTNVRPGMTAAVTIVTEQKTGVLTVPNRAIRNSGGQRSVIVLFEGNEISVPVTVGLTGDTVSEITSPGLKEGDSVLLNSSAVTTRTNNNFGGPVIVGGFGR
ncbi:MAG: efflux RND transporter periplasmic adaptor subunit [Omnitrophica WOR_2 bacterium]